MRVLTILSCVLCVSLGAPTERELVELLARSLQRCYKDLEVDKRFVINLIDKKDEVDETNKIINEFFECSFKGAGLVTEEGEIDYSLLEETLLQIPNIDRQKLYEGLSICKGIKGNNPGETIIKVYNCLGKHEALTK